MPVPLILARTFKQAHDFARERLDLKVGHYRVNPSASTIRSVRNTQIYLVPGWKQRSDRFGVQGALRYCRLEVIDVETWEQPPADSRGDLTERQLEAAYRYNRLLDLEPPFDANAIVVSPEEHARIHAEMARPAQVVQPLVERLTAEPFPIPDLSAEPAEEPKRAKRRSRCKKCEQLHHKDEPCPELEG